MAKSAVRFRDSVAQFERLSADIAARRFAPVYLLMGDESYFIDALCDRLASTILGEAERSFNQIVLYGRDTEPGQVINFCRQMPMMGSYEVVILKEAQQMRQIEKLSLYTQKPQASTILVVCHKEKSVDKRSAFYKQAAACGAVFESVRPRDYEIGPRQSGRRSPTNSKNCSSRCPKGRSASPTATSSGTSASRANTTISSCARPYSAATWRARCASPTTSAATPRRIRCW